MKGPTRVVFTEHAAERATRYDLPFTDIAEAILDRHSRRRKNPGHGDWQVRRGRFVVIYNWPDEGDRSTARVVTVWPEE
jgi:mRNA-degrading endonuclease RelE of RelBE toxin-antitoxin system